MKRVDVAIEISANLVGLLFLLIISGPVMTFAETPAPQPVSQSSSPLVLKAQAQGTVRLIVRLAMPFEPEGRLSRQRASNQRARISRTQDSLLRRLGPANLTVRHRYRVVPQLALEVEAAALRQLLAAPEVASIAEDVAEEPALNASVPLIEADQAWATGYTGEGWAVAILDTGIDGTHPFLAGKVIAEGCFSTTQPANANGELASTTLCPNGQERQLGPGAGVNCPMTIPLCEHGTHVAGIAAGKGTEFSGVAREANLIAMQVFSRFDQPTDCRSGAPCLKAFVSDQLAALEQVYLWHQDFQIASVNISIAGGQNNTPCETESRRAIIDTLTSVGIAVVVASGNDGYIDALSTPACVPNAVSVGATTNIDTVRNASNSAYFLDLLAPGTSVDSSIPGNGFESKSGTSMAAPHVAGAWAILKSREPTASVELILGALGNTGQPVTDTRNGITTPRIQVSAALQPNVTVSQHVTARVPEKGQRITYTIGITNSSFFTMTDLVIANLLPTDLIFAGPVGLSGAAGKVAQTAADLPTLAEEITLAMGQPITITLPITVSPNVLAGLDIINQVTLTSPALLTPTSNASQITIASHPAITIAKTTNVSLTHVGQTITYTYQVTNSGDVPLVEVVVFDTVLGVIEVADTTLAISQATTGFLTYTVSSADLTSDLSHEVIARAVSPAEIVVSARARNLAVRVIAHYYLPLLLELTYPFEIKVD